MIMISVAYVYGKQRLHRLPFLDLLALCFSCCTGNIEISWGKVTKSLMAVAITKQMLMYKPESSQKQNCYPMHLDSTVRLNHLVGLAVDLDW